MAADTPEAVEITGDPVAVYRFYDTLHRLLYVGISGNLTTRWAAHAKTQPWWRYVARKTVVMYGSREEAAVTEDRAILAEYPLHNIVSREPRPKPRKPPKRPAPLAARRIEGPSTFEPDAQFAAVIDEYADKRQISRGMAISQLVYGGLVREFQLDRGGLEELEKEMAAMAAYQEELKAKQVLL